MNTQANSMTDEQVRTGAADTLPISPFRLFSWSIRRELWENRSLYLAPAIVATLLLLGFFFGPFGLNNMSYVGSIQGAPDHTTVMVPYVLGSSLIMTTGLLVGIFYSVDALYAERRDRSILFWKSLPVPDLLAVLAKASIPLLVLPLIIFVLTVTTHLIMALSSSVALLRLGDPVGPLWSQLMLPQMWLGLLVHLLAVAALWYAPFYAWALFVSAWAGRAPLLWALLPPLALSALEAVVLHTSYIGRALTARFAHGSMTAGALTRGTPELFSAAAFNTPELWLGLITAAVFLAAAVQLRRYKGAL